MPSAADTQEQAPSDPRFTGGLLNDLCDVLKVHGYMAPQDTKSYSAFTVAALELANAYEGKS